MLMIIKNSTVSVGKRQEKSGNQALFNFSEIDLPIYYARKLQTLTETEKRVYTILHHLYKYYDRRLFISQAMIAYWSDTSDRTVRTALRKLEELQLVETIYRHMHTSIYRVHPIHEQLLESKMVLAQHLRSGLKVTSDNYNEIKDFKFSNNIMEYVTDFFEPETVEHFPFYEKYMSIEETCARAVGYFPFNEGL